MNYSRLLVTATALTALAACQPKTAATAACGYLPRSRHGERQPHHP